MIVKNPDEKQDALKELRDLLSGDHGTRTRNRIQKQIEDIIDGQKGEKDCAFHLNSAFASCDENMIIHDLVIEHEGVFVQIDHLVFTRNRQVFVIETKAISGTLKIDQDGSCMAVYESGKRFSMPSPIEQVRRHATVLRNLLGANDSTMREVIPVVTVPPKTKIKNESGIRDVEIVATDLLPRYILKKQAANNDRFVITKTDRASCEEVAGAAWLLSRKHKPKPSNWAKLVGVAPAKAKTTQAEMFKNIPLQRSENTIKKTAKEIQQKNAEEASKAEIRPIEIHQGKIDMFIHKDGKISLKWRDGKLQQRFHDECRSQKGLYNNTRGFWTLDGTRGRSVIARLKLPAPKQTDLFEPIDITIPELIEAEIRDNIQTHQVQTPHGELIVIECKDALARIQCKDLNPALYAHVRAICANRAQKDADLDEWMIKKEHLDEIIQMLRLPSVRMAS